MTAGIKAIITGMIRSDLEAQLIFNELANARHEGLLDRIIYASWNDHLDAHPDLVNMLAKKGIDVLAIPALKPDTQILDLQIMPFYTALGLFEDDEIIFRLRTDKCYPLLKSTLRNLTAIKQQVLTSDSNGILDSRILLSQIALNEPFAHADFIMMGLAADFRRLMSCDRYFDYFCEDVVEARWFARPFIQTYADIRLLFENIPRLDLTTALSNWAKNKAQQAMPAPLISALACYFDVCRRHFIVLSDKPISPDITLIDTLAGHDPSGWLWGNRVFIGTNHWLQRFATGERCGPFADYLQHFSSQEKPQQTLFLKDIPYIRAFIHDQLNRDTSPIWPGKWVKQAESTSLATQAKSDFSDTIKQLAYQIQPEFDWSMIEDIVDKLNSHFEKYSYDEYYNFGPQLENAGKFSLLSLQQKYPNGIPVSTLLLPALLFSAASSFSWQQFSTIWLAEALLENKISRYFAWVARWSITAKIKYQIPYVKFLAGMLLLKGIGGDIQVEKGIALIAEAAEAKDPKAKAVFEALQKKINLDQQVIG